MAYQFADGFDNYGNGTNLASGYPWDLVFGTVTATSALVRFPAPGSTPGGSVSILGGNDLRKNLTSNQPTLIVGMAFYMSALPASETYIFDCWDNGTSQISLGVSSTGSLQFFQGVTNLSTGTAIGTATANSTITANTWYGIACQMTFNSSTGSVSLYLNGAASPLINSTGLKTTTTANNYANQVSLGAQQGYGSITTHYDDFYCLDTTGGALNSLPGVDVRILTKMPSAAGNYNNWTPTGFAANYQNVAVTPPSVSDYNANNTPGTKDSYTMQTTGITVAPLFVVARASLTRDDANTHTPTVFIRSGTTDSTGTTTPALGSGYLFYDAVQTTDPNTGLAWTASAADAAQVGIIEG